MHSHSAASNAIVWRGGAVVAVVMNLLAGFATAANGASETVLHSFGKVGDGASPFAGLINVNGTLYGTTEGGGTNCTNLRRPGCGTVFSITPDGKENVLHSFDDNGIDGEFPFAGLINVNGTLYGTTYDGGADDPGIVLPRGTVFSITPEGAETVLHSFRNDGSDGSYPVASLISVAGKLYGTTEYGGSNKQGTVFSITPGGTEKVLHSFRYEEGSDGVFPEANLVMDVNGTLYGTTQDGGAYNRGTVFSITRGGTESVTYSFKDDGTDGGYPVAGLIANGRLYGTTGEGGSGGGGYGTVFSVTPDGSEMLLHSFSYNGGGRYPFANLINVNGKLYGTTGDGGAYNGGTVFSIAPDGTEAVLHSFGKGQDGAGPGAGLINVNGTLYGTTAHGGAFKLGTVFSITP